MASTSTSNPSAKSSFSQTLHFITDIKLQELEAQRLAYQEHSKVLNEAKAAGEKGDILKRVELLAKAVKSWMGSGTVMKSTPSHGGSGKQIVGGKLQLSDLDFWLQQAKKDPGFSREIATGWADTLEQHIRHTALRFDAAKLFGTLFNEWLASGDSSTVAYQAGADDAASESGETTASSSFEFVESGRKEMHEQKAKLESIIFDDVSVDAEKLKAYLEGLFGSEEATKALEKLRKEIHDFGYWFKRKTITKADVETAIKGLLATGLMDEEKRTTLKAFQENPTVLDEVASVLNMRMANIKSWSWPKEGILVEFRRHLNGKYRAFTDPEIIDALLLHYIGVAWQVKLKTALRRIFDGEAWERPIPYTSPAPSTRGGSGRGRGRGRGRGAAVPVPHSARSRRIAQLRGDTGDESIEIQRNNTRRANFFLSQFHDEAAKVSRYDDLVDAPEPADKDDASPAQIKRLLLHLMTTECYLNKAIHGSHATICSDLEWFGPSLPHSSILTVLEFLGMSKTWLDFYRSFLAAPIRFPGETEARVRKRGTPISYALSVVCGETILFMMDFAVNQRADGLYLYRMHDDLWVWDSNAKKVADGWAEMKTYASLVGLKFNTKKTGSAYVGTNPDDAAGLPTGSIRWGFLEFNPAQARFSIDQKDVDMHIVEMRRQLASTKSVFGWVNAYNKYMVFFLRNLGGLPANCVGKEHVVDTIDTLARIQRELFPDIQGGAVGYLRKTIETRFGTTDLPEGYFYFPISNGGLELRNIMLELLALERRDKPLATMEDNDESLDGDDSKSQKSAADSEPASDDESEPEDCDSDDDDFFDEKRAVGESKFRKRVESDRKAYNIMKKIWDRDADNRRSTYGSLASGNSDEFMTFEEYTALRESWLASWGKSYRDMLDTPEIRDVTMVPNVYEMIQRGAKSWYNMDWYEHWIVSMYGEEVVKKFGGLEVVDPNLIPIGMVELFRTSRMKLDQ